MALPCGAAQGVVGSGKGAFPTAVVGLEPESADTSMVSSVGGGCGSSGFSRAGTG